MKKNQIFIKCGTEYKEMTKELLEACDLAGEIEKKFETKSSLIDNSEAEVCEIRIEGAFRKFRGRFTAE